jgi:glutathione S-transferase
MLKIWGRKTSLNVQKVMWTIAELKLPHERVDAGGPYGGLDTPEYFALNPNRLVPTLQDGAYVLWESNAIARYLAAKYSDGGLMPNGLETRGLVDQWVDWSATTLSPDVIGVCFMGLIRTPVSARNNDAIRTAATRVGERLNFLDKELAEKPFILGADLSVADVVVGSFMYRYYNLTIERPKLKHVERWYADLTSRPAYRDNVMLEFESMKVPGA